MLRVFGWFHLLRKKKEQEVEAHLFGDKPVYVTNAYRKHQEEQAKYEAELDKRCAAQRIGHLRSAAAVLPDALLDNARQSHCWPLRSSLICIVLVLPSSTCCLHNKLPC